MVMAGTPPPTLQPTIGKDITEEPSTDSPDVGHKKPNKTKQPQETNSGLKGNYK